MMRAGMSIVDVDEERQDRGYYRRLIKHYQRALRGAVDIKPRE